MQKASVCSQGLNDYFAFSSVAVEQSTAALGFKGLRFSWTQE